MDEINNGSSPSVDSLPLSQSGEATPPVPVPPCSDPSYPCSPPPTDPTLLINNLCGSQEEGFSPSFLSLNLSIPPSEIPCKVEPVELVSNVCPVFPKLKGFALIKARDPKRLRAICHKGGVSAHILGKAHEFTPEEAREAGRKGGRVAHLRGTAHEFTPEEAKVYGSKGGRSRRTKSE